jgi:hypothetical protein
LQSAAKDGKGIKMIEMRAADKNPRSFNVFIMPPLAIYLQKSGNFEDVSQKNPVLI